MDLGEFRLARTLQHQAQSERKIDVIRQLLIQEPGFNSYQLFRSLANGKDFLSATDLTVFLHENNFVITKPDALQLLARYSKQSTVSYQDFFVNLELPDISLSAHREAEEPRSPSAAVSHRVLLAHKMKTEVETNRNSAVLKELLAEELGSNFYSAFRGADSKRSGYLDIADMALILSKFSITLTEAELDCLVRRYDSNRDGKISYLEFLTQLMPEGRVDSLRTPSGSPIRSRIGTVSPARITSSPYRSSSSRSPSRVSPARLTTSTSPYRATPVKTTLSFDNVADNDTLLPFNSSLNRSTASVLNSSYRSPVRSSPVRSVLRTPERVSPNRTYASPVTTRSPVRSPSTLTTTRSPVLATRSPLPSHSSVNVSSSSASVAVEGEAKRELETEFETMRQRLALHPSFTLLNAFKHLDARNNGFITIGEFRRCLADAGYMCTAEELETCVRLFDSNGDGRVSYSEFISKMMPTEAVYSELVSSPSAGGIRAERRLSIPAQLDLAKALKQRIDVEKQFDQLNRSKMYSWSQ